MLLRINQQIDTEGEQVDSIYSFLTQVLTVFIWTLTEQTENKLISLVSQKKDNIAHEGFTDWKRRKDYFKEKGIVIEDLKIYFEMVELQKINNKIKHLGKIDKEMLSFSTFKEKLDYPISLINLPLEKYISNSYRYITNLMLEIEKKLFE